MRNRIRTDAERRRYYRSLIRRQQESTLTIPQFCKRHRISAWTFYQWRKRLSSERASRHADAKESRRFVAVELRGHGTEGGNSPVRSAEVVLPAGTLLRIPPHYPPESMQALLAVLQGI